VLTDEATARYKPAPLVPFADRKRIVEALGVVDHVIEQNDTDPTEDLKRLRMKPHYVVHGSDWEVCPGEEYARENGGRLVLIPRIKGVSSTGLKQAARIADTADTTEVEDVEEAVEGEPELKPDFDKMRIAIGIKTYLREETLERCLRAIRENVKRPYRLYIADDSGTISDGKAAAYNLLRSEGHEIIRLTKNSGISLGRNAIVKRAREKVVLMMDDDIEIRSDAYIDRMLTTLFADPDMGVVAGLLYEEPMDKAAPPRPLAGSNDYQFGLRFERQNGMLVRLAALREDCETERGVHYRLADQVVNFFVARREVFDTVRWDPRIKVEYEHMDFFLALQATPWKAAVCLDAKATHMRSPHDVAYNQARRSINHNYFLRKHGIHRVLNRYD
jgi:GT2 family glycosyltransferase/glycerol-3-phosphate cytidylyltransferase-like family protein